MFKIFEVEQLKWGGGFLFLIIVQVTFIQLISIQISPDIRVQPDLVLLCLVFYGLNKEQLASTVTGFFAGLGLDILGGGILGLNALVKTIVGFLTGFLPRQYKIKQILQFCGIILVISLVHDMIYNLIYVINSNLSFWRILFLYSLPSSVYTIFIGGIAFYWIRK